MRRTNIPEDLILYARNGMAEEGTELTPEQVATIAAKGLAKVRKNLRAAGVPEAQIPKDDMALLEVLFS